MTTHSAHFGFSVNNLRGALHLPQRPVRSVSPLMAPALASIDWLERLAAWSDRQPPMHHRMGSYTRRR